MRSAGLAGTGIAILHSPTIYDTVFVLYECNLEKFSLDIFQRGWSIVV
jgi:hypothetical protein